MKMVMISQKEFDRLFELAMHDFQFNHNFMLGHENIDAFKRTRRYEMLQKFNGTMEKLKKDIERHPVIDK